MKLFVNHFRTLEKKSLYVMYGLVNKAVEDLIRTKFSDAVWEKVKELACVDAEMFVSMNAYDDDITYRLVGAASQVLGISPEAVLIEFGKYWVNYTAKEGYGSLLEMGGNSLPEFLKNLNALHIRVGMTYNNLKPPSFNCEELDEETLIVKYFSHRKGLAPLVIGLLHGLGDKFGVEVDITQTHHQETDQYDEFRVKHYAKHTVN